jgi:uncharacterized protein with von Willebrand factor type A (vWA) domain
MYPFGSLPGNLIAFGDGLRREYGFRIGAGEIRDAARALEVVPLANERAVRNALRPTLSRTREDAAVFDDAFTRFFFPGPSGVRQDEAPPVLRKVVPDMPGRDEGAGSDESSLPAGEAAGAEEGSGEAEPMRLARASYSPLEADAVGPGPLLKPAEAPWRDAARLLVCRLRLGLSRRSKPAASGRRLDVRRTLRASLQTGGEPLEARWLCRRRRAPRFVLLIDGSRSMDAYAATALRVAVAIASVTMRLDVFTFSTSLRRVTGEVRRAAAGAACRLEHLQNAWGGGTSIGLCLSAFLRRFGERSLSRDTVVIVTSDGLDVGAPGALRESMRELHRRSAGIVWLNPLLETPGYEPTAAGMSVARPFVSTLTSVGTPADLRRLAGVIRVRT